MMYCPEFKKDIEPECIAYKSMMAGAQEIKDLKDTISMIKFNVKSKWTNKIFREYIKDLLR